MADQSQTARAPKFQRPDLSLRLNSYLGDITAAWVKLFDPSTPNATKDAIKRAFRRDMANLVSWENITEPHFRPANRMNLPKDLTVAIIMTGAYHTRYIYPELRSEGVAERYVLMGYSSGLHAHRSFSGGASMCGNIFMPSEHARLLKRNHRSPILLADWIYETGLTYAVLGNSLRYQMDYEGPIYQMVGSVAVPWNGRLRDAAAKKLPNEAPILTEYDTP